MQKCPQNCDMILPFILGLAIRIIFIWFALPKVVKASTIMIVVCHCLWHFCPKMFQWKCSLTLKLEVGALTTKI